MFAQGNIAIDLAFFLGNKDRSALEVYVGQFQIAQFVAAESTAIQHSYDQTVLKVLGRFQKTSDFFLAQDGRQFKVPFDLGQGHAFGLHAHHLVGSPEAKNGVLKEAFGRGLMEFLAIIKVVFNVLYREFLRALFKVQRNVRQTSNVIV